VHSGVVIEGPVYIGEGVTIRPHANIRHGAYLGDKCVIGHSADVKNALALRGCKIQDGTFVGDSVLGQDARVGSGAILANRKFNQSNIKVSFTENGRVVDSGRDFFGAIIGDQARLGANVITSPGTVIGAHTWVGSGVVLHGYYGPNQLITVKQELEISPKEQVMLKAGKAITFDYL
jgi:NDP-sugar pyrophosphorylase family protein